MDERQLDKRGVARNYLVFYLRVFDGLTHKVLGYILDISRQGVMLVSDVPLEIEQEYQLRMKLPTQFKDRREIMFAATCKWCRRDTNPDFFLAGFRIDCLEPGVSRLLGSLIKEFGFDQKPVLADYHKRDSTL